MYERFEPSERIFVGREEYIQWMEEALERCREQSVVLHLRGIGGIGKSSLLDYWKRNITETIPLDCQQHNDFYSKLNALAKGAVMLGVKLPRFDVLWQIRQRFVEGVEPVRQEGREWAREVVMAIPFVGSLASIGSAISAVGAKVTPKLKQKYGALGEWLQTRVGKDYVQRLLEILWKEPRTAEFLYLDALAEDLNNRKTSQKPILFLLDHFEQVDNEQLRWRYSGREVSETELWLVFLSLLHNAVGVTASRRAIPRKISEELKVEESELAELDINSSNALLEKRKITDSSLQEKIAAVSGGNPFVIGALCDLADSEGLSPDDVEVLRGNTLEAVRLKTWRKLFSEAKDLQSLVEKAGLLPFFNRRTLGIIAPDMRTDHWDRLTHLSFVRNREDGNWVLHDLARQLIVAELGHKLKEVTDSAVAKLESAAKDEADDSLLGLAVSIRALESEVDAINLLDDYASLFMWQGQPSRVPVLLNTVRITTIAGRMIVLVYEAWALAGINRVADAEHHFKEAAQLLRAHGEQMQGDIFLMCVGSLHSLFGWFLERTDHSLEAEKTLQEGIRAILDYSGDKSINWYGGITSLYMNQGLVLLSMQRLKEADDAFRQSIKLNHEMTSVVDYSAPDGVNWGERTLSWMLAMYGITQLKLGHLGEARMRINEALEYCIDPFSRIIALGNLGEILRLTDMFEDAERVIREGAKLCEETYGQNPELHFFPIAIFLNSLAYVLTKTGRHEEAEEVYREALSVSRPSMKEAPQVFSRYVAWTLNDLAVLLTQFGRYPEAKNSIDESLGLYRQLSNDFPVKFQSLLAWALSNCGTILSHMARASDSEDALREALDLARNASSDSPKAVFLDDLTGVVLHNLGTSLLRVGNEKEAEDYIQEAVNKKRHLVELAPKLFLHRLPRTLNNLGILFARTNRESEAIDVLAEAVDSLERLYSQAPSAYCDNLIIVLRNQRLLLSNISEPTEKITTRLNELGFSQEVDDDNWSLLDEIQAHPPGFHVAAS